MQGKIKWQNEKSLKLCGLNSGKKKKKNNLYLINGNTFKINEKATTCNVIQFNLTTIFM